MHKLALLFILLILSHISIAADHQYRVSLLRAAPGSMSTLLEQTKHYRSKQDNNVLIMRHSQGDHWDIMLLEPASTPLLDGERYDDTAAFEHNFLVKSTWSWQEIQARAVRSGLFHLEMFHAAVGKKQQLLQQRQMENAYYNATGREGNIIFETEFGNDMDNFTLGFYKNMQTFATDPDLSNEEFEQAATDAGFKSRADIGLYLRQFISRHYDTLAVPVTAK